MKKLLKKFTRTWPWKNSFRVWTNKISYSNKTLEDAINFLEEDVYETIRRCCYSKKIKFKGIDLQKLDPLVIGILYEILLDLYDGNITDQETYLIDIFYAYFGKFDYDSMLETFDFFKDLYDEMPNDFRKGINMSKISKNKIKLLEQELLKTNIYKEE
jgi:hypothetical protein